MKRRESGSLVVSIVVHAAVFAAILNAAFHYDISRRETPPPPPPQEHVQYVAVAPPAGALGGGDSASAPAKANKRTNGLVAPVTIPTSISPVAPPASGTPSGLAGGAGTGSGTVITGIVPSQPDPRLTSDPHVFFPVPKSHAERVDSAVRASIYAYNDSIARALAAQGRKPGDWTMQKGDQKWGIDGNKIYLGKFAIPSAVLAALPIRIQGNPGETIADRLSPGRRADLLEHAQSQYHDDEFKSAVKRIRERKDKERREKQTAGDDKPLPANP